MSRESKRRQPPVDEQPPIQNSGKEGKECPAEIAAWVEDEEIALAEAKPKNSLKKPGKIATAMFLLSGIAAGAYHFIHEYEREKFDEAGVAELDAKNDDGGDLTRDEILQALRSGENPFYASDILLKPELLKDKSWQKEAILLAAEHLGNLSLQYGDSFFSYLSDEEITTLLNKHAIESPEFYLANYNKLEKFSAAKKFLPAVIARLANKGNGFIFAYLELVRTLPDSDRIIFEQLSKLSPEQVIHFANQLRGDLRCEKIVDLSVRYLLDKNPKWLVSNFADYNQCKMANETLREAASSLAKFYPREIFSNFKLLAEQPWIMEILTGLLEKNPDLLIHHAQLYKNLPGGEKLFLQAYKKARIWAKNRQANVKEDYRTYSPFNNGYDDLIEGCDNYQGQPDAGLVAEQAFKRAAEQYSREVVLENLPKFYSYAWAKDILKTVIEKYPRDFLEYFEKYKNLPGAEGMFNQAIAQIKADKYPALPTNLEVLFFYPAGVELIKFYAEKESFDILYSYKILLRHPEGQKILGNYLRRAVKQDPERIFNAFSNKNEFLEDPWVRAWFFEHAVELDLFSFSLMLNKTKDWQDNENIIKKIVAKSSPKSVLTFAQHLYAMDRVWAVSILPEVFSSATEHDKSFYIYTLIGLKEPALKNVLMEYAKKLPKSNILFYWQYFKLLDQEWARGLVLELLPTLSIQGILQNFRTICEVDAEFGKKLVAEKLAGNFGLAIESYYQYRAELPNSTDIFLKAIKIASELNPGLVVENGKKLQELPGGEKFLLAALEKLVVSDPRIVFVNFKEWADLSIESVRPLIRIATINDPGWALMVLSQSGDLANLLRSILATDQDPNIEKLLAWDKEATVTADKQIGAILLFNGKNSLAEIKEIVGDKDLLFLSLVEIMSSGNAAARASADRELAGLALRQVREVNDLHERPDTERFKLANKLNASELYTLIVYGEEEEFTSTYNGFFNRLLEKMKAEQLTPKSLLAATGYNKFRVFIKLATQFNRLGEFLALMDSASQQELLSKFAGDIEKSPDFLAEAVSVADTFSVIEDAESLKTLQAKVKQEYERVLAQGHREGVAIYGLLAGMFSEKAVIDEEWIKAMAEKYHLTNIAELPIEDLVRDKKIVQQYCFFNDADGKASYQNFLAGYRGQEKWKITEYQDYVVISSVGTAKQVEIYANKPESYVSVVNEALQKANLQPTVLVHRGHSYHAQSSVNLVTEHTRLVSLGSCGGYNLIDPVLEKSKTAHIISTKGTGAMSVNDPLLKLLNEELAGGHNLNWSNFWAKAEKLLGGNKYFGDYVPPNKNLGVLFLKAYREHLEKDVYDADVN